MLAYWMSFSSRILTDSANRSSLIHDGFFQCSFGITSIKLHQYLALFSHRYRHTISAFRLCRSTRLAFEFGGKGDIVEEGPRVVELVVPCPFQILHRLQHPFELFITDECQEGRGDSSGSGFTWRIGIGSSY